MTSGAGPVTGIDFAEVLRHFDIYDRDTPEVLDEALDYARRERPVSRSDANGGYYLLSRYDDVTTVLADDARLSSRGGKSIPARQMLEMPPLDSDPPEHRDYRRLLNRFFSRAGAGPARAGHPGDRALAGRWVRR